MSKLQLVFVHDHTGSMGSLRLQVRRNNCEVIRSVFSLLGGTKTEVGVITVCDNHDVARDRDFKEVTLTSNADRVIQYLETVPDAMGNSSHEECYERAFHRLRSWKWDKQAVKIVIFVGDSIPHPTRHFKNPEGLDCLAEARALVAQQGVSIIPIRALTFYPNVEPFYRSLEQIGGGPLLRLDQFSHIEPLLLGIVARAGGQFEAWEAGFRKSTVNLTYALQRSLDTLAGRTVKLKKSRNAGKGVADEGRFQVYKIDEEIPAAEFFCKAGVIDSPSEYGQHKGRLFYAHEKRASEEIRPQHEVIVEDDRTGEMIYGEDARAFIGIPYGTKGQKLERNFRKEDGYTVWIQSKSVGNSRHLELGQRVMIDMNPSAGFRATASV